MSFFTQVAKITDYLFLCGAASVTERNIREYGITSVINLTLDVKPLTMPNLETYQIRMDDTPNSKLSTYFDKVAERIHAAKNKGGKTLVHCVAGVSRSATMCIAYLMRYHKLSLLHAYTYVKTKRPVIRPNNGFFRQLIDYEKKLFGRTTVKMVSSPIGNIPDVYLEGTENMVWWLARDQGEGGTKEVGAEGGEGQSQGAAKGGAAVYQVDRDKKGGVSSLGTKGAAAKGMSRREPAGQSRGTRIILRAQSVPPAGGGNAEGQAGVMDKVPGRSQALPPITRGWGPRMTSSMDDILGTTTKGQGQIAGMTGVRKGQGYIPVVRNAQDIAQETLIVKSSSSKRELLVKGPSAGMGNKGREEKRKEERKDAKEKKGWSWLKRWPAHPPHPLVIQTWILLLPKFSSQKSTRCWLF